MCSNSFIEALSARQVRAFFEVAIIVFYCGVNERQWNHHPVTPGPLACISPVYGKSVQTKQCNRVTVPSDVAIIKDSGAFCDSFEQRLSVEAALERQVQHAERYGYAGQISHRASYDLLIDEKWEGGIRHKTRWSEQDAEIAVAITVQAAAYLTRHRHGMKAVLSAQGVSALQYLRCSEQIVPFLEEGDIFGLGGAHRSLKFQAVFENNPLKHLIFEHLNYN